jgi:hypothetical protein
MVCGVGVCVVFIFSPLLLFFSFDMSDIQWDMEPVVGSIRVSWFFFHVLGCCWGKGVKGRLRGTNWGDRDDHQHNRLGIFDSIGDSEHWLSSRPSEPWNHRVPRFLRVSLWLVSDLLNEGLWEAG